MFNNESTCPLSFVVGCGVWWSGCVCGVGGFADCVGCTLGCVCGVVSCCVDWS